MKHSIPMYKLLVVLLFTPAFLFANDNVILNGDFASGELTPWTTFQGEGGSATIGVVDGRASVTNINLAGSPASWHIQFFQPFSEAQIQSLEVGETYRVSFDVHAAAARPVVFFFGQDGGSFTALKTETLNLPAGPSTHVFDVVISQVFGAMKFGFEMGTASPDVSFDNISLTKSDGTPAEPDGPFTDITVSSGKPFTTTNLLLGATNFIDRNHTITAIPDGLNLFGATMLRGANDDRDINIASGYITFTVTSDVTVYVAYDSRRIATAPAWLVDNWTNTEKNVGTSDVAYRLYSRSFTAGQTVNIGGPSAPPQTVRPNGIFVLANDGTELPTETDPSDNIMEQDFILFANGRNVTIPTISNGTVVPDPENPENTVVRFDYGNWNIGGFNWGAPAINMQERFDNEDMIHMRIWSSPQNSSTARQANGNNTAKLIFMDGSTLNSLQFRTQLALPDEIHVGQWLDVSIPLPAYASQAELDSAKIGKNVDGSPRTGGALDGYAALWEYWGSWSDPRAAHVDNPEDPDWREFNWNRVRSFGIYWDQAQMPNAPIYINNLYIGKPDADLSVALQPPAALSTVQVSSEFGRNTVSFTPVQGISGYNIYFSGDPITDLSDPKVFFWRSIPFTASEFSASHRVVSPLVTDSEKTYYYAVAPTNLWGLENRDVSSSVVSTIGMGPNNGIIFQLEAAEENTILDNLEAGIVSLDGWPVGQFPPFQLNRNTSAHPSRPPNDDILSGVVHAAYGTSEGELIFYVHASVTDDALAFNPMVVSGTNAKTLDWNSYKRDQVEIRIGTYEVDFVTGTTRRTTQAGDYLINLRPYAEVASFASVPYSAIAEADGIMATFAGEADYQFTFPPAFEYKRDAGDNIVGYEIMFAFTANELLAGATDAELFTAPGRNEFSYIPFTVSIVDDREDAAGRPAPWEQAAYQLFDSWKPNFGPAFFATPSDLSAAAIVGRDLPVSIERNDDVNTLPQEITLRQNYPNPFNPTTMIEFSIPEMANVSLRVYNSIGQQVAVLANNQTYAAGRHQLSFDAGNLASGMYIYRLESGGKVLHRKMMLVK